MIEGVKIKKLEVYQDDRGILMELLRSDEGIFTKFGQTTFTLAYRGVIKAFHWHRNQDDFWFVAQGSAQIVLYDRRPRSQTRGKTQVIYANPDNRVLIKIPKGVVHGYKVLGNEPLLLFYHTTSPYNHKKPDEERIAYDDPQIGFDWQTKYR